MRQSHPAGERLFVDYARQTVNVIDPGSGEIRPAQIFVGVLGASNCTYAEAPRTQTLPDSHVRAPACIGGVPAQSVPDNPNVGVNRANWYEPGLNRTYLDLATHYGTAILPTRTRKPRDKAKVEVAVLVVERWILARLRDRRFFTLAELNRAIAELVAHLKARPMRRLGVSRRELEATPTSASLLHAEWLALLLDREATERYERRFRARLHYARLRHQAAVEDVDYRAARSLDRAVLGLDRLPPDRRGAEPSGSTLRS